jgi:hypothetical protein
VLLCFQKIQKDWQILPIFSKMGNSLQKNAKSENMKTKIFSYPSIVLATYQKPNSEIGQFSHFWSLKP